MRAWLISILIILFTLILVILTYMLDVRFSYETRLIPLAIGISGFIYAGISDGHFVNDDL